MSTTKVYGYAPNESLWAELEQRYDYAKLSELAGNP